MKRASLFMIVWIVLVFGLLHQGRGLAQRQGAQIPPDRQATAQRVELAPDKVVSTQQRINRYFHNDVVPKLKPCWRTLRGTGRIQFEFTFTKPRAGSRWTLNQVATSESSLQQGQEVIALKCMQTAVLGTSFAATPEDRIQTTYMLHWSWPVPLPANADALTATMFRMRATGGGTTTDDCDGSGTKAKCQTCDLGKACKTVCVGYKTCTISGAGATADCTASGYCASGGPFGVGGGTRVIF